MRVDLDDYASGATLATELVNTSPGVWHGEEQLDLPALTRFLAAHGVTPEREPTVDDLEAVRALRGPLRAAIEAGEVPGGGDDVAARAGALVARAGGPPTLTRDDGGGRWRWTVAPRPGATLADRLALRAGVGLLGVLRVLDADRFRDCASETCSGVFVDISRAGRRRYCMPGLCGNRAHVAAHRARRRAASDD